MSSGLCKEGSHSPGSQERWPNMFAHAMGHSVFSGTAGAAQGGEE